MNALTSFLPFDWLVQSGFHYGFVLLFAGIAAHAFSFVLARMIVGGGASLIVFFLIASILTHEVTPAHPKPLIEPDPALFSLDSVQAKDSNNAP